MDGWTDRLTDRTDGRTDRQTPASDGREACFATLYEGSMVLGQAQAQSLKETSAANLGGVLFLTLFRHRGHLWRIWHRIM
jgi:hypothetical protein